MEQENEFRKVKLKRSLRILKFDKKNRVATELQDDFKILKV